MISENFGKFGKLSILKNSLKSVISNMSSVWCFFKSTRHICNHLYLNSIKTAHKTLIFLKKLFFAF